MAHVLRLCAEGENEPTARALAGLAALVPKQGVRERVASDEGSKGYDVYEGRMRRRGVDSLCRMSITNYQCPDSFGPDGRATCATDYPGERYELTFRKTAAGVHLDAIEGTIFN